MSESRLHEVLERSRELGLLGPGDFEDHVVHAQGFVDLVKASPAGARVLDLGSGGGLPGLVIAAKVPHIRLTLLDASERRVAFLRDALRSMEVTDRVVAAVGRAEDLARQEDLRETFDVLVSRSFGAPAVTAECGAAFLRRGGVMYVSEPADSTGRWPHEGLEPLGLSPGERHEFPTSTIQELLRTADGLSTVPRRVGVPARRPLF